MVILIITFDVVFILVGWDGLGVIRFLLVVYYMSPRRWSAGVQTFLVKRLGDGFMVLSVVLLLLIGGGSSFLVFCCYSFIFSLLFVIGLATKSAIYPFCRWLPAAMAAPTPVSALVHSSTLVTAGLYVLVRVKGLLFWGVDDFLVFFGL